MFKKLTYGLLFLLILTAITCHQKNPISPPAEEIPATMPQTDIPWPSLANSPWPMSTVNPQGIARTPFPGPKEGKLLWTSELGPFGGGTYGGPAIGPDGTIYVSFSGGSGSPAGFAAISPDGKIKWTRPWEQTSRYDTGPVVAVDTTIYVGGSYLYAIRPNGSTKWQYKGENKFMESRPLLGIDGTIYAMDGAGNIFALSPEGKLKWKNAEGLVNDSYMVASIDGQTIYAPGRDSTIMALDAQSGSKHWSVQTHTHEYPKIAVDNQNNIYFYGYDQHKSGFIYSISPAGQVRWRYQLKYNYNGSCNGITLDYNGNIYFCFRTTGIIALDYAGKERWVRTHGEKFAYVPIISDATNNLYVLNIREPLIWCYDSSGNLKYSTVVPLSEVYDLRQGAIGADGTLYLMSSSRWLVAIK